jgi:glycosyltransferase involved in cell wall biosynthesis
MAQRSPSPTEDDSIVLSQSPTAHLTVGILLCTFNGERYLREQLDSFISQTHREWQLFVSDDGSTDGTLEILEAYQGLLNGRMTLLQGPRKGFGQNFLSLIRSDLIIADAYAFSDQDDIWLPDKLERSLAAFPQMIGTTPCLYCSRTQLIDTKGADIGLTPLFSKRPSFRNALVQSLAGANTMLINEATRRLMARTAQDAPVVAHDWLAYIVVSGCGGQIVYDPRPTLLYRQHDGNLIGANTGVRSRFNRIAKMLGGRLKHWNEKNLRILQIYVPDLTPENQLVLAQFSKMRSAPVLSRIAALRAGGFYRQTLSGTISLYVAVALRQA